MWIPSFHNQPLGSTLATFLLMLVNTAELIIVCYRRGISRMYDLFSGFIYLLLSSTCLIWHTCWQGQLITATWLSIYLLLMQVDHHTNASAAEETFLASILIGLMSYFLPTLLFSLVLVYIILARRQSFDGKAFLASLIGMLLVALYAGIAIWFGKIDFVWADFFSTATLTRWFPLALMILSILLNSFFYSREHSSRGIGFFIYLALCLAGYIVLLIFKPL